MSALFPAPLFLFCVVYVRLEKFVLWSNHAAIAIITAWMSDLCPDPSSRAVIVGVAGTWTYIVDAFANIFIYPAKAAPNYPIGYKAALAFALTSAAFMTGMLVWERKTRAHRCACNHEALCQQKEREAAEERDKNATEGGSCCQTK